MNKQEAIKELNAKKDKNEDIFELENWDTGLKCGARGAYENAIAIVKQIDEPEKVLLSKAESEWLECVKRVYKRQTDRLHIITRQGWGYDFEVTIGRTSSKLSYKPYELTGEDTDLVKQRLVNALLYGYDLKKEKLYTVEIPNPNASGRGKTYLAKNDEGKIELFTWSDYSSIEFENDWKKQENAQLTAYEIREEHEWAWRANLEEEVEE